MAVVPSPVRMLCSYGCVLPIFTSLVSTCCSFVSWSVVLHLSRPPSHRVKMCQKIKSWLTGSLCFRVKVYSTSIISSPVYNPTTTPATKRSGCYAYYRHLMVICTFWSGVLIQATLEIPSNDPPNILTTVCSSRPIITISFLVPGGIIGLLVTWILILNNMPYRSL